MNILLQMCGISTLIMLQTSSDGLGSEQGPGISYRAALCFKTSPARLFKARAGTLQTDVKEEVFNTQKGTQKIITVPGVCWL